MRALALAVTKAASCVKKRSAKPAMEVTSCSTPIPVALEMK
jgi:hypothetical protein